MNAPDIETMYSGAQYSLPGRGRMPAAALSRSPAARRAPARHRKSKILNRSLHKYEYMFEIGISSLFFPQIFWVNHFSCGIGHATL